MRTLIGWLGTATVAAGLSLAAARGDVISHGSATIAMDFVSVVAPAGSANPADSTGYGSVGYTYRIGAFEVTAGQYRDFLNAADPLGANPNGIYNSLMDNDDVGCQITRVPGAPNGAKYDFSGGQVEAPGSTAVDWENRPANYVSWYDAARFCNWLTTGDTEKGVYSLDGPEPFVFNVNTSVLSIMDHQTAAATYGRAYFIPTEDEWYKAAYYDPTANGGAGVYYDYPTASNTAPASEAPPGGANAANYSDGTFAIGDPYYRTNVGAYTGSDSAYGTFDQGGNVWEFNESLIGSRFGVRGGSFLGFDYDMSAAMPADSSWVFPYYLGFRVASIVPEPGALGLLVLGLAGVALGRGRAGR